MATWAARAADPNVDNGSYVRILRWTFTRDGETVHCELGLAPDDSAYQLRIDPPWKPAGIVERFDDAMSAFQRHAMIERQLLEEGWTLESFDSLRVAR